MATTAMAAASTSASSTHDCCPSSSDGNPPAAPGGGSPAVLQLLQEFLRVQACRAELYSTFSTGFRHYLASGDELAHARLMQQLTPGFNAASKQVIQLEALLASASVGRPDLAALLRRVQEAERDKLRLTLSWQALRAAHASGRFSWQAAADRPCATMGGAQREQAAKQQQQQLLALLQQVELRSDDATTAAAAATRDQGPHVLPAQEVRGGDDLVSIKPGFYAEQLQRAAADAAAAAAAAASRDADAKSSQPMQQQQQQQQQQAHGCCGGPHHHHSHGEEAADVDPLEPSEAEYLAAVREALQQLDGCVAAINDALAEVREAIGEEEEEEGASV